MLHVRDLWGLWMSATIGREPTGISTQSVSPPGEGVSPSAAMICRPSGES
jgi:hypothetical protein